MGGCSTSAFKRFISDSIRMCGIRDNEMEAVFMQRLIGVPKP